MKQLIACLVLVASSSIANAQGVKAPPVCVDDRLTVLEDRISRLEKALKQAEAAAAPAPASVPVQAMPVTSAPQGTTVTYSYNASGSYTQPAYSPVRSATYFPRVFSSGEGAPVCGPNGCGTPMRIRIR